MVITMTTVTIIITIAAAAAATLTNAPILGYHIWNHLDAVTDNWNSTRTNRRPSYLAPSPISNNFLL